MSSPSVLREHYWIPVNLALLTLLLLQFFFMLDLGWSQGLIRFLPLLISFVLFGAALAFRRNMLHGLFALAGLISLGYYWC